MTSGEVYTRFKNAVDMYQGELGVSKDLLKDCCSRYGELVPKRNALVHAHPITDIGGSQILNYQGAVTRPISDLKWSAQKLAEFIEQIDKAVSEYSKILHSIKPGTE